MRRVVRHARAAGRRSGARAIAATTLIALLAALGATACGDSSEQSPGETTATAATETSTVPPVPAATPVDERRLPLGDGRVSEVPKRGFVLSCATESTDASAVASGDWINEARGTWDSTAKPVVQGAARWPWQFTQNVDKDLRILSGSGLPPHTTGAFPVDPSDPAYAYDPNPNELASYSLRLAITARPERAPEPGCLEGTIGVMKDGIPLHNPLDAAGDDAQARLMLDSCGGHPDSNDEYHYHALSPCIDAGSGAEASTLVGWALDGYGIYVERDAEGTMLSTADLDACHGRTSEVEWNGRIVSIYHYVATLDFPYTIGCFRGTPTGELVGLDETTTEEPP